MLSPLSACSDRTSFSSIHPVHTVILRIHIQSCCSYICLALACIDTELAHSINVLEYDCVCNESFAGRKEAGPTAISTRASDCRLRFMGASKKRLS